MTSNFRHGVMMIGAAGTGKSTIFNILIKSIEQLFKEKIDDPNIKPIILFKLNPKSMSLNNLFGYVNLLTNEWNDGIIANIMR